MRPLRGVVTPLFGAGRGVAGRVAGRGVLGVGEQVPGTGGQFAGDRRGGDLPAPPFGDALEGGRELWGALGGLRRLAQHPAQPHRALFGDVPVVGDPVAAADGRGEPGPDASWRAEANRLMSPASARMTSAVNGPMPGNWVSTLTRGSDRVRWRISQSSRSIRPCSTSIRPR